MNDFKDKIFIERITRIINFIKIKIYTFYKKPTQKSKFDKPSIHQKEVSPFLDSPERSHSSTNIHFSDSKSFRTQPFSINSTI